MKIKRSISLIILWSGLLAGCASNSSSQWHFMPLAVPLQPSSQQEVKLAKIDQLLLTEGMSDRDLAQLFYERGLVNDSLGLRDLARLDFNRSLAIDPAQSDVFNVLGIYFTQNAQYDAAYEAFDSSLELNENNQYALRNRGIALYYGGRLNLAERDLLSHYQANKNDVYRSLWLYLVEVDQYTPETARQNLQQRLTASNQQDWAWMIAQYYLGEIDEKALLIQISKTSRTNEELAARLCEAYFYLAKGFQKQGNVNVAIALYKLAIAANMYEFVEHRYAILELNRILEQRKRPSVT